MERLGPSDYEAVLDYVREVHAIESMRDFPRRAMAGICHLIDTDMLTYNEIDTQRKRAYMVEEPVGAINPSQFATFERLSHQHPLINHYARTGESRPRKISDFISLAEFRRLDLYQEFFRVVAVSYQMAVTIPSANGLVIGIAVNRNRRDFSERDRSMLDLVRPHLAQAYRNLLERTAIQERADAAERARWSSLPAALGLLTRREHDVLDLVAVGKTNAQIARRLTLSPRTVQKHLEHVYEKLGVHTRTAAAMTLGSAS